MLLPEHLSLMDFLAKFSIGLKQNVIDSRCT